MYTPRITRSRTALGLVAAAAVTTLLVAGCSTSGGTSTGGGASGGPGTAGSTTAVASLDDGTSLTMWVRASLKEQAQGFVDEYNQTHKNQVQLTVVPDEDYQTKVGAAAGSRSLPDLLSADVVYLPNYTSKGLLADLTSRIDALPFASDLAPSHVKAGTWDGKKYAVPFVMDLSVLFYNKDIYQKAGLDPEKPPTTLAEFASQAEQIAKAGIPGVSGTYFGGNCGGCLGFTWLPSIWASGNEPLNADGTQATLNSADAQAVYSIYRTLFQDGAVAPGAKDETGATWVALFPQGKVGVQPMPSSQLDAMPASTGVAAIPGPKGGESTFVGGDSLGIAANSKHIDQAWDFAAWTLGETAQLDVIAKNNGVVVRSDLADNQYAAKDPRLVTINKVAAKGQTPFGINIGTAFNDPNGPWLKLVRDQVFGDGSAATLDADNAAMTAALKG